MNIHIHADAQNTKNILTLIEEQGFSLPCNCHGAHRCNGARYSFNYTEMKDKLEEAQLNESEQLAEKIDESVAESNMTDKIDITFTSQYVQLTLKGALLFDSGKTEIRAEAVPVVDKVGRILENYAGNVIEIEGHTDNVPMHSAKYANNSELSCGRALAVYDYLISTTNLDPSKIKYAGRGEYVPVADNSTEEGRAKNRRVEIRIYHDLSTYE